MMRKTMTLCIVAMLAYGCIQKRLGEDSFVLLKDRKAAAMFLLTKEQEGRLSAPTKGINQIFHAEPMSSVIKDFNEDLRECAGVELPVTDVDDGKTPVIRFALESRPLPDEDRFSITFPDLRTMLISGSPVGARWALNHVLEKFAGVRWLARSKNSAHFPQLSALTIPRVEINMQPDFNLHREMHYPDAYWFGRSYNKCGLRFSHAFPEVVFPIGKYMAENKWPDFIFPTINGKKFLPYLPLDNPCFKKTADYYGNWQPCLTDDKTADEAVKNICAYFDKNPEVVSISLGVNDCGGFCECDNCRKLGGIKSNILGMPDYSELYYKWCNRISEAVTKKHPDKYFGLLAYREVITPPSFKLHKNIVPFICFDAQECMDPAVKAERLKLFRDWAEKADNVGWWDYGAGNKVFDLPRVYFGLQQEMMKIAHAHNVRAMFVEAEGAMDDGPKKYLYNKWMWDVNADLGATLQDWYEACVGKEAAPYLAAYFQLWETFWKEKAVKSDWFQSSKNATYLHMGNKSYLYAVEREDLQKAHELMEKVVQLADKHGDRRQQLRAGWLMRELEYSEACVYAIGGEILPPSGDVENAEQALEYLESLPKAVKCDSRRMELYKERKADPDLGKAIVGFSDNPPVPYVPTTLPRIASFCSDPRVKKAFQGAAKNPDLPAETRSLCDIFLKLGNNEPVNNLLKHGSFENGGLNGWVGGQLSSEKAFQGKNAIRFNLQSPFVSGYSKYSKDKITARPGTYLVSAMVYVKQDHYPDVEEYVKLVSMERNSAFTCTNSWDSPRIQVKQGQWNRVSMSVTLGGNKVPTTFGLDYIIFYNYRKGDVAYVDDIIVVPLNVQGH